MNRTAELETEDAVRPAAAGSPPSPAQVVVRAPSRAEADPVGHRRRRRMLEVGLAVAAPLVLLIAWEVCSRRELIEPRFFPAPSKVWSTAVELFEAGTLQTHVLASVRRMLIGFVVGCGLGVVAGTLLSLSRTVRVGLQPLIYALWTVPKLALLPLLLLIFGLGEMPIIILVAINCFFLVAIPTTAAMIGVPASYREATQSFSSSRWSMLRHVTVPASLPQVFVALRLAAGASILVLVAAEFVQGDEGLGYLIWNSWSLFLADRMYVGIVLVAVVGALFTMFIGWVGHRLSPWYRES